jgi:hypothetical protein
MDLASLRKIVKRPLLSELVLGRVDRPCERCKCPTLWAKPRQTTKGFCPDHALLDGPGFTDALKTVMRAFPGSGIEPLEPEIFEPDEYAQHEERVLMRGRFREVGSADLARGDRAAPAGRRPVRGVPARGASVRTTSPPLV